MKIKLSGFVQNWVRQVPLSKVYIFLERLVCLSINELLNVTCPLNARKKKKYTHDKE